MKKKHWTEERIALTVPGAAYKRAKTPQLQCIKQYRQNFDLKSSILKTWGSVYISNSDIDRDCQKESWKYQRLKIYKIFDVVIECSLFKLFVSIWTENLTEDGPSFGFVAPAAVVCVDGFAPTALQEIISWKDCQSRFVFCVCLEEGWKMSL